MKKMKKFLFLLLLIPFGVNAQDSGKWEIGFNTGAVFSRMPVNQSGDMRWRFRDNMFLVNLMTLSGYHNFNRLQVGLRVDGGTLGGRDWWMSPQAVANYKIQFLKSYIYGGGVFGYVREQYSAYRYANIPGGINGLMTGLQVGTVVFPGKRIGINLETGVRFKRMYSEVAITDPTGAPLRTEVRGFTETYIPVSLGIRYRF